MSDAVMWPLLRAELLRQRDLGFVTAAEAAAFDTRVFKDDPAAGSTTHKDHMHVQVKWP